jgi:uroporphyrinogen-III synthase
LGISRNQANSQEKLIKYLRTLAGFLLIYCTLSKYGVPDLSGLIPIKWYMDMKPKLQSPLKGKVIALPESRQLDILSALFQRRGALVDRIPLVSIIDAPDQPKIRRWLKQFISAPPDYFVLLTGEGLRRLLATARRMSLETVFISALSNSILICRGPKPGRVLREIQLQAHYLGTSPTSAGIVETLRGLDLAHKSISVQLYGEDPNDLLMDFLGTVGAKIINPVAPYKYAQDSNGDLVFSLINRLHLGKIDLIAFTSKAQVKRLFAVATQRNCVEQLTSSLKATKVAAIGPIVKECLEQFACTVEIMPSASYFMKPMVRASEVLFAELEE